MREQAKHAIRFTYEDYLHFPDDRKQYHIVDGEVYTVPTPVPYHQVISMTIGFMIHSFVDRHNLGEVLHAPCDVILSNENVVQPDIFFISKDRLNIITEKNITGPPDLVIEILSPYTEKLDRTLKKDLYARYGVLEYWLVDLAAKSVEILSLSGKEFSSVGVYGIKDTLESKIIRGLLVNVEEAFRSI